MFKKFSLILILILFLPSVVFSQEVNESFWLKIWNYVLENWLILSVLFILIVDKIVVSTNTKKDDLIWNSIKKFLSLFYPKFSAALGKVDEVKKEENENDKKGA